MQVSTKTITLNKPSEITTSFIENSFKDLNLNVIRWAIVEVNKLTLTLDVAVID